MGGMTIPLVLQGASMLTGNSASRKASNAASDASDAQNSLLQWSKQLGEQYGPGLLNTVWNLAMNPYQNSYATNLTERSRQGIESGYRPAFAQMAQGLSSRGMWNPYSSQAQRGTTALDLKRGSDVSNMYSTQKASQEEEQMNRLGTFSNLLAQLRGSNIQAASAYSNPISTYSQLASGASGAVGQGAGSIAQLLMLNNMMKQKSSGSGLNDSDYINWYFNQ
jgi:hypothetical protein